MKVFHSHTQLAAILAGIVAASTITGCGEKDDSHKSRPPKTIVLNVSQVEPTAAATPKAALRNLLYGIADANEPQAQLAVKTDNAQVRRIIAAVCLSIEKMQEFKKRLTVKYGDRAFEKFNSKESSGATLTIVDRASYNKSIDAVPKANGDELLMKVSGFTKAVRLFRTKVGWLVDGSTLFEAATPLDTLLKQQLAIIKLVDKYNRTIPDTTMDLAELDKKMGEELLAVLMNVGATAKIADVKIRDVR